MGVTPHELSGASLSLSLSLCLSVSVCVCLCLCPYPPCRLIGWTGSESVVLRKRLIEYRCQLPSTMSHTLSPPIPEGRAWRWLTCNTFPHEWTRPVESVECPCVFLMFAHEHSNKVCSSRASVCLSPPPLCVCGGRGLLFSCCERLWRKKRQPPMSWPTGPWVLLAP